MHLLSPCSDARSPLHTVSLLVALSMHMHAFSVTETSDLPSSCSHDGSVLTSSLIALSAYRVVLCFLLPLGCVNTTQADKTWGR